LTASSEGQTSVVLLGSTGSIGRNTLDVISRQPGRFSVFGLAAGTSVEILAEQVKRWHPARVVVRGKEEAERFQDLVSAAWNGKIAWGDEALSELAADSGADIVVNALVGALGLRPTVSALEAGHRVALANKESLVMAGPLLKDMVDQGRGEILPVDSEHNALFQLLDGRDPSTVSRLVLTASGGPFRTLPLERLEQVTVEEALRHPTWKMGPRITVDSATLMNKGLEVIEAESIFGVPLGCIEVWVHPQSIVHGIVELVDGSMLAQLSQPDMRIPIQFALTYPERHPVDVPHCSLPDLGSLDFETPDPRRYPCLELAKEAAHRGGLYPSVLNAADEVAVHAFLQGEIPFTHIPRVLERVMNSFPGGEALSVGRILEADRWAREEAGSRASSKP
jgi:1-deoxy-D-xylulose-5-phosphate reductoisomerase